MKKTLLGILFVSLFLISNSQDKLLYIQNKGDNGFELTLKGASHLASLPLKCISQEFPNKTNHTSSGDSDHVLLPKQLHPAFFGCFDWHSSVHGHWMLIRLLKLFPQLPESKQVREALNINLTRENLLNEVKYFELPLTSSWERTYGWAWILKLDQELMTWNDPDGKRWHENLQPLTRKIIELWKKFLPKQTYPNRSGVHPNTAFGLVFALDYAMAAKNEAFERSIVIAAKTLFTGDKNIPAKWEPNGSDFLSPSLEEADLMLRVLDNKDFLAWFNSFISLEGIKHLAILPVVSDRSDLQIVHLDGLSFSRAWCMQKIASVLHVSDARRKILLDAANKHLATALPHVVSGEYGGEHWLASFAVYALLN